MKKLLAVLTIVAMLAITSSAMAKSYKPPKLLCLDWDSWNSAIYTQLSFKAIGTIIDDSDKVKTYAVTGIDSNGSIGPVSGNAYVVPGTTTLHATYSGMFGGGLSTIGTYELFFDLETESGILHYRYEFSDGTRTLDNDIVYSMDCNIITSGVPSKVNEESNPNAPSLQ